jgi:hypothetical protein
LRFWIRGQNAPAYSVGELVLRYLAAFGPASAADAQAWSGLTRLREVFDCLRPQLVVFRDDRGRELFDLPDAPRPPAGTPAPARFLPAYDNLLLGHADRSRFLNHDLRSRLIPDIGTFAYGSLLVDGAVSGVWRTERHDRRAVLDVKLASPLPAEQQVEVAEEGRTLLQFWGMQDGTVIFGDLYTQV